MARIARILFPVDFSENCAAIAGRVKALAERFESEVVMIYSLPPLPPHVAAFVPGADRHTGNGAEEAA